MGEGQDTVSGPRSVEGIHHVALIASDRQKAMAFYAGVLGFEVIAEHYRSDRQSWKIDLGLPDGSRLELFTFPEPPPRPTRPEALGLRHLALAVGNVAAWRRKLMALHIACEDIRTDPFTGRQFFFLADPDSLPIELYEAGPA